jgi:glycosyltransferase involved in cell wall biosynthesis
MSKYTVVIPTLAGVTDSYLRLCVESLRDSGFDGRIIVVTNGAKSSYPLNIDGISVRLHTADQGQCNAVNIGMQHVDTEYALICNDDMYFAPGWDVRLRFDYACFSPNLVEPENNHGSAAPFSKLSAGFTLDEFDRELVDEMIPQFIANKAAPEEAGFNFPLFIKMDLWKLLGGYDTAYDPWGSNSDTDLQTRINLAGLTPMRLRDVLVYHFSNKSGTFDGTHQDFYINNIEYFHDKFGFDRDELGSDVWYNKDMIPTDETKIRLKVPKYEDIS